MIDALEQILPEKGTPITMRQASLKYGVSIPTIPNWVKYGWVTVLDQGKGPGSKVLVDEHDVAYIVANNDVSQGKRTLSPA